jgi:hypothetical protein
MTRLLYTICVLGFILMIGAAVWSVVDMYRRIGPISVTAGDL